MAISVFNLFSVGIGPSSSHTVGPMRAAKQFVLNLEKHSLIEKTNFLQVDLYGSLALTGKGHATDLAILLGLEGYTPEGIDPNIVSHATQQIRQSHLLNLLQRKTIPFEESHNLIYHYDLRLPYHSNAMRFTAYDNNNKQLKVETFYSVGGGFIVEHKDTLEQESSIDHKHKLPYPFKSAAELLSLCQKNGMMIRDVMFENEKTWRTETEIKKGLLHIWDVMQKCVERGCFTSGILPGGLNVKRRAPDIYQFLLEQKSKKNQDPAILMDWISLWALAVNEENAAGGRVVTAPTNGAAGIIPSVMHYYQHFTENPSDEGVVTFLLTAAAMGILYKEGASLSAAEMGCQGEVGVACSMAAGALAAVLGGSNEQIENAAEIGMEHNLGLTCDPVKGLVQIPCIERNTMGAVKAINAARLSLRGDGIHRVSLDQVIKTMRQIGHDMNSIYKETSLGGLAVNVPEC